ncbi:heptose-I-phosphate ethanolaminephosphotransferase [Selenomonas sp. GACV-9]|uniref:phosphoethanolamine transferase n=1 Tax=Selenomonas sp. GACV-9 TaxID=3158782 RepID=UPI0008E0757C|nr:heptose-I-phosphate ethanolaminephosphotransferase [Selenomonas ruminantium]
MRCIRCLSRLKKYKSENFSVFYMFLLIFLNTPYLFYQIVSGSKLHSLVVLERSLLGALALCFILSLIKHKCLHRIAALIIFAIAGTAFFLDCFSVYQYGYPFNTGMFDVIISTNKHEALEYVEQFVTVRYLLVLAISILGIGLIVKWAEWIERRVLWGGMLVAFVFAFGAVDMGRLGLNQWWMATNQDVPIMRLFHIVQVGYENVKAYEKYEKEASKNVVSITRDDSDIPYVIFIVGESTSRNHMSLYGYDLNTNPLLSKRKSNEGLYVFSDVISHHSHTLTVMRELFTFYRRGMDDEWFRYDNLFDILRQTNYRTVWLSNQESSGVWSLDKFYSKRCTEKYFTEIRESREDSSLPDGALLPMLDNMGFAEKNFVVVHLMGTHGSYDKRYPQEFAKFKADDETKGSDVRQKQIRAEYDNAVLYNDYIVDSIIEKFKNEDAIVIYVSDHADEVYEDRDFVGHTESQGTKHMIEIPMLIWTSDSFSKKRPALTSRIAASVDRPFMTDDMIHVLLDILSIETKDYEPSKSVINKEYEPSERKYNGMQYMKTGDETTLVRG